MMYRVKQLILVLGDVLSFAIGFYFALAVRHWALPSAELIGLHQLLFTITIMLWVVVNFINGLYDVGYQSIKKRSYRRFIEAAMISLVVGIVFFYVVPSRDITPKTILLLTVLFGYTISAVWRIVAEQFIGLKKLQSKVLFIGYTPEVAALTKMLDTQTDRGYRVCSIVVANSDERSRIPDYDHVEVYSSLRAIRPAIHTHKIHTAVIAPHIRADEDAMRELYELLFWPVQMVHLYAFYEMITGRIPPSAFSEDWFLDHLRHAEQPVYTKWRSLLDYVAALCLGLFLLLLFPFVAIAIKLDSKGPLFYKQERIGQAGKHFFLHKFRSMYALSKDGSAEVGGYEFTKKGDARITRVGHFLRKTRIDELPQIWNLLRRDITLIGPRPERPPLVKELTEAMSYYPLRHVVRPGLTGWAVLHQHYADSKEKSLIKLQYDLYYIKNRSFVLDLSILLRTINVILRLRGQ